VAVVTLNWNGWRDTIELLSSLDHVTYERLLIIVIDNASTDDSVPQIREWLTANNVTHTLLADNPTEPPEVASEKHYILMQSTTNLGFCAGNNLGMEWSSRLGAEYILILNNDTLPEPGFLQPMVDVAQSCENIGLVSGVITYCDAPEIIWWAGGAFSRFLSSRMPLHKRPLSELEQEEPYKTGLVSGCMMMIPCPIYLRFGGFSEEYFIWSEDWDYSLRLARAGLDLMVAPQSRICHKVSRSLGFMKPLSYYYGIRNDIILKQRHLSKWLWFVFLLYYFPNRVARFIQLFLQGRSELTIVGLVAVRDGFRGKTGEWQYHDIH
jgi:GT2 family glycosyltransferase